MAYSTSINCLLPVIKHLQKLKETKDSTVLFPSKNPRKLAYLLRQAIKYVNDNSTDYGRLSFTVKEVGDSVLCVRKLSEDVDNFTMVITENGEPISGIKNMQEVVGYCVSNSDKKYVFFTDYIPKEKELLILTTWGSLNSIEFSTRDNKLIAKRTNA